jgi:DNA invertase Pin-like site-specific DNA recombinase
VPYLNEVTLLVYGYARVSTKAQSQEGTGLESQIVLLREHGAETIFSDTFSGIKYDRPQLTQLLNQLASGDTLVVSKLDRIARSLKQGNDLVSELIERGVRVNILNIGVLDNSPSSKLIRSIFFAFAEFERDMIVERTQEGKLIAKADPDFREGRPKLYKDSQINHALELLNTMTFKQVENLTGISKSTLSRAKRKRTAGEDFGVKQIPISDVARSYGLTTLPKGKYLTLKEHDSVIIDPERNCFWRNSTGASGSVIDFVMEFGGASNSSQAIRELYQNYKVSKVLKLPNPAKNNFAVKNYLLNERKISEKIIDFFFEKDMLYQDERNNCVFVSKNFACLRGTGKTRFVIDVSGSNYDEGFFVQCSLENETLIVTESVIDAMSIMSVFSKRGEDFTTKNYLALCGTNKLNAIFNKLKNVKTVKLAFDNDDSGRAAMSLAKEKLQNVEIIEFVPPKGKDWNEFLMGDKS